MATFKIHQDIEKENAAYATVKDTTNRTKNVLQSSAAVIGVKDKRTFGVLATSNNVRQGTDAGGVNQRSNAPHRGGLKNDENAGVARYQQKKFTGSTPVEQFKAFSVYEDDGPIEEVDKIRKESMEEIRNPVKDDSAMAETPMSVADTLSPMSIDRSQLIDDASHRKRLITTPTPKNDRDRFFEVVEYQMSILEYFRESEKTHRPKPHYMLRQPDINEAMRTILVDWLVEVAEEYKLDTETLYLAVSYVDRFLSQMSVVRAKLQLVGTAAMYIAAKYEEIYPPDVGEFVFITDDTYTKAHVLRMEQIILKILSFDLCVPTAYAFLNTYSVLYETSDKVKYLAQYISELSLLDGDLYLCCFPSMISSSALALARYLLDYPIWCTDLENITSYKLEDMKTTIICFSRTHMSAPTMKQQAIRDKYKDARYLEVSTIPGVELDEKTFERVLDEYKELSELHSENSSALAPLDISTSNESVRKMISSLIV